jgi:osmotically-inducible protein OsmY
MNKSDLQLKQDIEAELRWDPKVNPAQIGVTVDRGVVTLLGTVDSWAEKWGAEAATKRVAGVRTVAQDLTVKLRTEHVRTDPEIAAAVESALHWDVFVPKTITAEVEAGHVTLRGTAAWNFQRSSAERAVRQLAGVLRVSDQVTLEEQVSAKSVEADIRAALERQAKGDAHSIHVETSGGTVTLRGHASSFQSVADATAAAWAAPGVTKVVDRLDLTRAG